MTLFRFSDVDLDPAAERRLLEDPSCGGFVSFEGWVRNHNEGLEVRRLEYEAFAAGVQYALTKMNIALDAADLPLEVAEVDLVESMGFMLVRTDDTPESFVKRVMKKPVVMVESWVD